MADRSSAQAEFQASKDPWRHEKFNTSQYRGWILRLEIMTLRNACISQGLLSDEMISMLVAEQDRGPGDHNDLLVRLIAPDGETSFRKFVSALGQMKYVRKSSEFQRLLEETVPPAATAEASTFDGKPDRGTAGNGVPDAASIHKGRAQVSGWPQTQQTTAHYGQPSNLDAASNGNTPHPTQQFQQLQQHQQWQPQMLQQQPLQQPQHEPQPKYQQLDQQVQQMQQQMQQMQLHLQQQQQQQQYQPPQLQHENIAPSQPGLLLPTDGGVGYASASDAFNHPPLSVYGARGGHDFWTNSVRELKDVYAVGKAMGLCMDDQHCDDFAHAFVEWRGDPVNTFRTVVTRFISDHGYGKPEVTNVAGLLFYLQAGHKDTTLGDLVAMAKRVAPAIVSDVEEILRKASFK